MANLLTHFLVAIALFVLSIWRLFSSVKSYLKNPTQYAAKPVYAFSNRFKFLELYLQLAGILLAMLYFLINSTEIDPLVKGSTPVYHLTTLQTVAVLAVFLVLTLAALGSENGALILPPGYHFLIAALGFGLQWMVLESGAALTSSIEGKCESLLGKTAGVCCGMSLLLAFQPKLFLADLGLWSAVLQQGLWFLQSGLMIHVKGLIPEGCHRLLDVPGGVEGSTRCDLEASRIRAMALLDLLYIVFVIVVVIIDVMICSVLGKALGVRKLGGGGYEPLSNTSLNSNHKVES